MELSIRSKSGTMIRYFILQITSYNPVRCSFLQLETLAKFRYWTNPGFNLLNSKSCMELHFILNLVLFLVNFTSMKFKKITLKYLIFCRDIFKLHSLIE